MVRKRMLEIALKLLQKIEDAGFSAYLVGGFVRDYVLGIPSCDIDVATSATPMDIKALFMDACLSHEEYGSITVMVKQIRFEITTFRRESHYVDHRRPLDFEYITDLVEDLRRRDFTMNTLCMNKEGEILDYFHGIRDIHDKVIRTVGNASDKFREDALRILRAVRFSTTLDFTLSEEIIEAIQNTKKYLSSLSYQRKREELDKIFTSKHVKEGIALLTSLGLDEALELPLHQIAPLDDLLGIWSCLDVVDKYPFTSNEKELLRKIEEASHMNNFDPLALYRYGLYVNRIAAEKKGFDKRDIVKAYDQLPIYTRKDILITSSDIMALFHLPPGPYLSLVYQDLEVQILRGQLQNKREDILAYLRSHRSDYGV